MSQSHKNEYLFGSEPEKIIEEKVKPIDSKRPISKGYTMTNWVENVPKQVSHSETLFGDTQEKKVPQSNNPLLPDKYQSRYSNAYIRKEKASLVTSNNDTLFDHKDIVEVPEKSREMIDATQRKKKNTTAIIAYGENLFDEPEKPHLFEEAIFESVEQ